MVSEGMPLSQRRFNSATIESFAILPLTGVRLLVNLFNRPADTSMARNWCRHLAFALLFAVAVLKGHGAQPPQNTVQVSLGQAAVPLFGPWKFTVGDSPIDPNTGTPVWAEPGFDDSAWETVDLTPKTADAGYVPGWNARGHAGYWGWAWYRLRVEVSDNSREPLAIAGPNAADDAWQLFVGGRLVGSLGQFGSDGKVERVYNSRPLIFPLLQDGSGQQRTSQETLAIRVWMGPGSLADAGGVLRGSESRGGLHSPPILVAESVAAQARHDWQDWLIGRADEFAYVALFLLLAVLSASLMLFDRSDTVYVWVAATMLVAPLGYILDNLCATTTWLDSRVADILISTDDALWAAGWVIVWWVWFRFHRPAWVPKAVLVLMLCLTAALACNAGLGDYGFAVPHGHNAFLLSALAATCLILRLLFVAALGLVVWAGIRKEGKEGWLALPAVAILGVEMFAEDFGVDVVARIHGVSVKIWDVTDPLLVAVLAVLMLRRLLQSLERQRQMALDVKQAQEVQEVILPEHRIRLAGFEIESEYRAAREVGGDFFQVIPLADDGLLIVAGDVTGKGLKAGMLVALLVGAIRTAARFTSDPTQMLAELNHRLLGRGDARATCLVLRIAGDGSAILANAGHLPPYLNDKPVAMEGSLPLGMIEDLECSVLQFQMVPSDRLLLVSDGVPEATNLEGKLFGFDRVLELVRTRPSAAKVAEAAQKFGQEDDISVISVTRMPMPQPELV